MPQFGESQIRTSPMTSSQRNSNKTLNFSCLKLLINDVYMYVYYCLTLYINPVIPLRTVTKSYITVSIKKRDALGPPYN